MKFVKPAPLLEQPLIKSMSYEKAKHESYRIQYQKIV